MKYNDILEKIDSYRDTETMRIALGDCLDALVALDFSVQLHAPNLNNECNICNVGKWVNNSYPCAYLATVSKILSQEI